MITLLELRDKLLEYINGVELQMQLLFSSLQLKESGAEDWNDQIALETNLKLCDEVEALIPFTDYIHLDFINWLESVTGKIDSSLSELPYFKELLRHIDQAIEYGFGDKTFEKLPID
ncbi:MAG TPA: hypothetical protein ENN20_04920 [Candidatus Marinimicrobia bacterium]|nr:hypothetical protein [Candidatus Neomarinimicrobiota bacterium]